ncbi:MAG: energy-coupling factor ABC transporter ATP-binding protein [Oscillospiraceae bacterium]|nr:energy-coupling factor ABC transporter ATP-binding protein [Oscillospiraceae bacterium]
MAHIEIRDLTFTYPGKEEASLQNIDLSVEPGEFVLLCGHSGSGKTTLLRHLKTVLTPHGKTAGTICINGKTLASLPAREQAASVGFVMQDPDDQIVTDKVWHELAFGLESLGTEQKTMRLRVAEMASYFGIQGWFHRNVSELSGGQKQLLNLASVMAMQPEILILDEPTSQLDPIAAADFLNTVKKINRDLGTTVLITEHRLEEVYPYADRVVVMEGGKIIANGSPRQVGGELYSKHMELFSALPTPARVFYGVGGKGECPLTVREGRRWLLNSFPEEDLPYTVPDSREATLSADLALKLKDVWFRYEKDSPDVLRQVEMEVPVGSLYAIVGGNGTGKSTLLKTVCGICRAYRGKIELMGKHLKKYTARELFRGCVTLLPQDPKSLFAKKTVEEELAEMEASQEEREAMAKLCRIQHLLDRHPYDLSGGEQQRVALAKVLLTRPRILLLDEPTKGLDGGFKIIFARILQELKEKGLTVVMVSHDVEFCAEHADLVSMFFDGQLLTTAAPGHFFGQNSFYTTAANRMSRCRFTNAVTVGDVTSLYEKNRKELRP